jgi:hypothetical protein
MLLRAIRFSPRPLSMEGVRTVLAMPEGGPVDDGMHTCTVWALVLDGLEQVCVQRAVCASERACGTGVYHVRVLCVLEQKTSYLLRVRSVVDGVRSAFSEKSKPLKTGS